MYKYELALILSPQLDMTAQEKTLERVKKIITAVGGKTSETKSWGKFALSYAIKKQKEGLYFLLDFELEGKETRGVEEKIKIEEGILRHLLLRKE